ncbi:VOC family protein [Aquimarina sp. RZ0]|uniref:VOC family protein n=1 Tax=Aquimarina sp. RZ0 TaxID=2607730 RepID=UPI0011F1C57F|nr:VOC family protein [Aquimarina sp. RZ0]KAA1247643.1 glyoxalase/bleomycin resistance/dioxygenase family protein [Aquimarina sp. RZ0]
MKAKRTGTILYVKKYKECVEFYNKKLELPILFQNSILTCFDLFGAYLMIENDDRDSYQNLNEAHQKNFSCIRIHVDNVKKYAISLQSKHIEIDYQEHDWGIVAKFFDPDGNLIALKDEASFLQQIIDYQ